MENNEKFSIDDILSEVKKRREENELSLKGEVEREKAPTPSFAIDEPENSVTLGTISEPEADTDSVFTIDEPVAHEEAAEEKEIFDEAQPEVEMTEAEEEPAPDEPVENAEADEAEPEEATESEPEETSDDIVSDEAPKNDGMVDLLSLANDAPQVFIPDDAPKKPKLNKNIKIAIIVLVVLIIGAGTFAALYINNIIGRVTDDPNAEEYQMDIYYDGMDFLQEDFPMIEEMSAYELNGYKDYLKQWYEHGDPVSSTHVLNVLLIGEDTRDSKISDTSRADSAIIASINVDTGEIHLTSILRDLYVYYEVDGQGHYGKINESAALGGMRCYIKTIERYYKIAINNYAVVNFASFPKIIDALNGVRLKITTSEIYEINNHPKRYGGVTIEQDFEGNEGYMTLNGKQALAYCRIRNIDSDGARADRQKNVLKALLKKMQKAGKLDTVKVVNQLSSYVYTGFSKKDLIGIGNKAITDGWLDFKIMSRNVPRVKNCKGGQTFSVAPNNWIWLADIPNDAYQLQMEIYGKSNIKLSENRADYIALGR